MLGSVSAGINRHSATPAPFRAGVGSGPPVSPAMGNADASGLRHVVHHGLGGNREVTGSADF